MSWTITHQQNDDGKWNFFVTADNGRVIAASVDQKLQPQNYEGLADCEHAALGLVGGAIVKDPITVMVVPGGANIDRAYRLTLGLTATMETTD